MLAAGGGHSETVKALVDAGALKSEVSKAYIFRLTETALTLAARGGHAKTVQVLIEAGANVDQRNQVAIIKILPYSSKSCVSYCIFVL